MKTCSICNKSQSIKHFYSNGRTSAGKQKTKPYCKPCEMNARKERTMFFIKQYHELKCKVCGYDRCETALELHHLDPTKKEFGITRVDYRSETRLVAEIKKCVILCSICHRELHAGLIGPLA